MKNSTFNLGVPLYWLPPKILLIMRLIIIIMTALLVQASAASLAQKVTYVQKNATLEQVFNQVRKQTGYDVLWPANKLDISKKIDANFKQASLAEVMGKTLENLSMGYGIDEKTIVIREKVPSFLEGLAERWAVIDVRGVVRNEKGEALEGITVVIKGANRGTTTNAKGEFFLSNVDEKATLVFSGVIIETYEVRVRGKESMEVNVRTKQVQLEEVGVTYSTGYQKIPKERATGSFVFIDSATINRRVDGNILARLKNLVPGLLFDKSSTEAGKERLQLRGMYSFSESMAAPLIVVDNFPYEGDINNINPNDVENITILRDAAAASIWGAKAGNGVIVLTTKQGTFNQRAQVTLNSSLAFTGKPDLLKLPIASSNEIVDLEQFLYEKGNYDFNVNDPMTPVSKVALILEQLKAGKISKIESDRQLDLLRNTDIRNDLLKYSYRSSIRQGHALNISGGSNFIKYFISAGYNRDLSGLKRNENTRYTLSSNNTIHLIKNLLIQTNVDFSNDHTANNNAFEYGSTLLNLPNYYNLADGQGNALAIPLYFKTSFTDTAGKGKLLDWNYRPLDELNNNDRTTRSQSFAGRVSVNYTLLKGLKVNADYQYSKSTTINRVYNSIDSYFSRNLINLFSNFLAGIPESKRYPVPFGGVLDLTNTESSSQNLRGSFSFNQNWDNRHELSLIAGAELREKSISLNLNRNYGYSDELSTTKLIDYMNPYPTYFGYTATIPDIGVNKINSQRNRFTAIYANGSYTYNNTYTFSGSIRKDAANVLGVNTNQRGRPFWSAGLAWKLNKEKFYSIEFLPTMNVRISLGNGGNTSFGHSAITTISYVSAASNPIVNLPFARIRSIGNPDLRWEKVRTLNFGLDFGVKNDLINGSIEYYKKHSADVLASRPLDPTTGLSIITANSANIKGSGVDVNLNAKIIRSSVFKWNVSASFSLAKFIVSEFLYEEDLTNVITNGNLYPIKGHNPYLITSYKWMGLDPNNGDPQGFFDGELSNDWDAITNFTPWDDVVKHGSAVPVSFGNLINNLTYRGFTFSTNIVYKFNYYFRRPQFNYFTTQGQSGVINLSKEYSNRWEVSGDEKHTSVPSFSYPFNVSRDIFYGSSSARVEKGDHIRVDDFSLSYSLSKSAFKALPFKTMSVMANVSNLNLILWRATKTNLDPENPAGNIASKSISLGVNLTF